MYEFEIENIKIHSAKDIVEIKSIFSGLLEDNNKKIISFINPEIFMFQEKNPELHKYFEKSKYNFIDGIGLLKAINCKLKTNFNYQNRFPGTDFFKYLPDDKKIRFFLYGASKENIELAKDKISKKNSNIEIVGTIDGYSVITNEEKINIINNSNTDILIVCLGCPKQEMWIKDNFDKLNAKIIFGNGGAIDFWSGNIKRAPDFLIKHNLEWLFRLFQNFTLTRIKRQLRLVKFLFLYKLKRYNIREI